MVVGEPHKCKTCDAEIPQNYIPGVYVRVNFERPKDDEYRRFGEAFVVHFCSIDCLSKFDWNKLKTPLQWFMGHSDRGAEMAKEAGFT